MAKRVFNFSSGPAALPLEVLEKAQSELLDLGGSGMSVMEMSHRSPDFEAILERSTKGIRDLLGGLDDFEVLFLQGGATAQFSMIPMSFLGKGRTADYVVTGIWGEKAAKAAGNFGTVNVIFDGSSSGYRSVPDEDGLIQTTDAAYLHYTSNETIDGVEFPYDLSGNGTPVVCDASSNILSRRIDTSKYDLLYAGAQKNIGPSGVTLVIVRNEMLERINDGLPPLLDYRTFATAGSMPNTPNTWGIYMIGLVCDWLTAKGGVAAIEKENAEKARLLYAAIDSSDGFFNAPVKKESRSRMSVTFRTASKEIDEKFCAEAERHGLVNLRGHRTMGGIRASIYNAMPIEGVEKLIDFMSDFAARSQ